MQVLHTWVRFLFIVAVVLLQQLQQADGFIPCSSSSSSSSMCFGRRTTSLCAKKAAVKKAGADVTVRLLQDSKEGLGQKGTIVKISAALWTNVYQPKKMAERITAEEEAQDIARKKAVAESEVENAKTVKNMLEGMETPYEIKKKVGGNGQLFGGVKTKDILEIIKSMAPADVATNKWAVLEFKGEGESTVENQKEIRAIGNFAAMICLHPDVKAKFKFDIVGE
jgi:ribosomal protein L9